MKKIVAGGFLMLVGVVLFLGAHIPAAIYTPKITSWRTPPGRYGTAIAETGGQISMIIAVILGLSGILLLLWGSIFENSEEKS